jgi:hypothetical protein
MPTVQTSDGFTVTSNHETADGMKQALTSAKTTAQEIQPTPPPPTPKPTPPTPPPPPTDGPSEPPAEVTDPTAPATPGEQRRKAARDSVQARIDRAVAAQRDAERERDHWKTQALTPQQQREQQQAAPPPAPRQHPGYDPRDPEPSLDQFGGAPDPVVAYVRELGLWSGRQEVRANIRAQNHRAGQQAADAREQGRASSLAKKISDAVTDGDTERIPEFLDTISDDVIQLQTFAQLAPGQRPTGRTAVAEYIVDADHPHLLMRHFTDHPEDLQRLSTLPPSVAFGQMGKLEQRLEAAHPAGPAPTPVSRARSPIKPVAGSQRIVSDSAPKDSDDLATFIKKGNALDPRINPKLAQR